MTVTTTNQDPAPTRRSPAAPATAADRTHRRTGRPRSRYSGETSTHGPPLVRRAMRPSSPISCLRGHRDRARRWGGTDSSESNVSFAWSGSRCRSSWPSPTSSWCRSWRSSGCSAGCAATPAARARHRTCTCTGGVSGQGQAVAAAPPLVRPRGHTRPQRRVHRFESPQHHRRAVAVPWSSVTELRLHRSIAWGKAQRGHLTIGVTVPGPSS